jgi:DNA-binding NarL/FixJ family response regulator
VNSKEVINVLVVSDDDEVISKARSMCNDMNSEAVIRIAGNVRDGITEIVKNGFDITIFDAGMKGTRSIKLKDLVEMNHFVNKNMIVLCDSISEPKIKRIIKGCKLKDSYIYTLNTDDITPEAIKIIMESSLSVPKRDSKKILRKLMSEIDKNNQSIFQKYKFLSFI